MQNLQNVIPDLGTLRLLALGFAQQLGHRMDDATAGIWAEHLRSYEAKLLEEVYPDLLVAKGDVLPVDTGMDPAAEEHVYYSINAGGYADWLGDDLSFTPNSWITANRHVGYAAEMVAGYDVNFFEIERSAFAAKNGGPALSIDSTKAKQDRRNHEAFTDWVWSFGAPEKRLFGVFNHPNITVSMAPLNTAEDSRKPEDKSNDEIAADFALLVDTVANQTLGQHFAARVYVSRKLAQIMRNRRLGAGDGFATLWDWMINRYKGDDTGQGKISFRVLNYCDPDYRRHPKYGDDRSGIAGEFMFAMAELPKDEAHFKRARPYTQLPPRLVDFNTFHRSHSKIGGATIKRPLAFHRVDFGA